MSTCSRTAAPCRSPVAPVSTAADRGCGRRAAVEQPPDRDLGGEAGRRVQIPGNGAREWLRGKRGDRAAVLAVVRLGAHVAPDVGDVAGNTDQQQYQHGRCGIAPRRVRARRPRPRAAAGRAPRRCGGNGWRPRTVCRARSVSSRAAPRTTTHRCERGRGADAGRRSRSRHAIQRRRRASRRVANPGTAPARARRRSRTTSCGPSERSVPGPRRYGRLVRTPSATSRRPRRAAPFARRRPTTAGGTARRYRPP